MTEQEWLVSTDSQAMLKHVADRVSERKSRLFACACVRHVWHLLTDERSRLAVEVAERFADGEATVEELSAARYAAWYAAWDVAWATSKDGARAVARAAASYVAWDATKDATKAAAWAATKAAAWDATRYAQATIVRDILGNPWRMPILKHPLPWIVRNLAEAAYSERLDHDGTLDPDRLTVLADALEESGCLDADILDHLRGPGPHYRGCWALDLILNKEAK